MPKLDSIIKKAVRAAMLNEDIIAHKIVPNLSVVISSAGNRIAARFENTRNGDSVETILDKKGFADIARELATAAGISANDLVRAETTGATPIGELLDEPIPQPPAKNVLDGFTKIQAKKLLWKALKLDERFKGGNKRFSDESWKPINDLFNTMREIGLDYDILKADYRKEQGIPMGKMWQVEISFKNENGKDAKLYLTLSANGCGTVEDPLSKYDVIVNIG